MAHPLTLYVKLRAIPGREDELRRELEALTEASRRDAGCLHYDLHVGAEDPLLFAIHETWADGDAHAAHRDTPHVRRMAEYIKPELVVDGQTQADRLHRLGS